MRGENMSTTKAQQKAVNKYVRKNYERVLVTFKQKGKKESIKAHADAHKESVNGFINRAIDETMERDNAALPDNINKQKESGSTNTPDFK